MECPFLSYEGISGFPDVTKSRRHRSLRASKGDEAKKE